MSKQTILICDDRPERRQAWQEDLAGIDALSGWKVELLAEHFDDELDVLRDRQREARKDPELKLKGEPDRATVFDQTSILLVDYDLIRFDDRDGSLTGEIVAYLVRCYSDCDVIVGVNLTGHTNPFDLTLIDHLDSFADVNVGSDQLTAPALWGMPDRGLSPWSWPSLPSMVERQRRRAEAVGDGSGKVLETLGLSALPLSRQVRQAIEADGSSESFGPTFAELVEESTLGLRGDDRLWKPESDLGRIGAARAHKWLETLVVPAQDVLADAPHIAQRNPLLLEGDHEDEAAWARTTDRGDDAGGLIPELQRHRHAAPAWTDKPLWHWAAINGDDSLPGVAEPWSRPPVDRVFCEDVSKFLPSDLAREFVVDDVPTTMPTRFVADSRKPQVKEIVEGPLDDVEYLPRLRFTL